MLRSFNILLATVLLLYWTLTLLCPIFTLGPRETELESDRPCSNVCPSLNFVKAAFFLREYSAVGFDNKGRVWYNGKVRFSCRRFSRIGFTALCYLLLLSGDVELNPGPIASPLKLKFAQLNARSAVGTTLVDTPSLIQAYIIDHNIDLLALSETWLRPDSLPSTINSLLPDGYTFMHVPRPEGRGGGVAFIYRSVFEFRKIDLNTIAGCEIIGAKLIMGSSSCIFVNFYRPPSSSAASFCDNLLSFLEHLGTCPSDIFLTGDFNFHVDTPDSTTRQFLDILDSFDLLQYINFPTHRGGHTLDLFIGRSLSRYTVSKFEPTFLSFTDHLAVSCDIDIPVFPRPVQTEKKVRLFKGFVVSDFTTDLLNSGINYIIDLDLDLYVNAFMSTIHSLLDKHAPWKTVKCSLKTNQPFYTRELREQKRLRSRLESIWRRNKTEENFLSYRNQVKHFSVLLRDAKRKYYRSLINKYHTNSHKLWSMLNNVVGNCSVRVLPTSLSDSSLAKSFSDYFTGKISRLMAALDQKCTSPIPADLPMKTPPPLLDFEMASENEVRQIITHMSDSTCTLDVIPTKRLKDCLEGFIKPITVLINKCFSDGKFPKCFKKAVVVPLLKKHNLPKEDLSSYRPVSHLNFISKIIEKLVHVRLLKHINSYSGFPLHQSAYRMFHSTETTLLKVQNDLLLAMEQKKITALALLDLSAAFDTVDHTILAERLKTYFGLGGKALSLMQSYLSGRTQSVEIGDYLSPPVNLTTGVPQGSILGPLLFSLYMAPLEEKLKVEGVQFHFYADDTQIYLSFPAAECSQSLRYFADVLAQVHKWFTNNRLTLNADKTEFMFIGTRQQRDKLDPATMTLTFDDSDIRPVDSVRNLGFYFDSDLNTTTHVTRTCQTSFFYIRNFRRIRTYIDINCAKLLANAFVLSRLDYCNSLLYGANQGLLRKLQIVQNSLARVVMSSCKCYDHITPVLRQLHWLPVKQRILYKTALLTFKILKSKQPAYLHSFLQPAPLSNRRSSNKNLLIVPFIKSERGRRAFSFAAPTIWNSLPQGLRDCDSEYTFRKKLKTFYFPT